MEQFARILEGTLVRDTDEEQHVASISIHSDRIQTEGVFFALIGSNTDGHRFVGDALRNGAIAAVVTRTWMERSSSVLPGSFIAVDDTLRALQRLATWWRNQFAGSVIGITGSSGKTTVKDILLHVLSLDRNCSANPGSFNSQLGVPLSILRTPEEVDYSILEAGISAPGEMVRLAGMIRPDFGILTNIGWAHISSFRDQEHIAAEKIQLFHHVSPEGWVLVPSNTPLIDRALQGLACRIYRFGASSPDLPYIMNRRLTAEGAVLHVKFPSGEEALIPVNSPFPETSTDVEIALCAAFLLGVTVSAMVQALTHYIPVTTRLESWKTPNGVTLLNDAGSSDPLSIQAALRSLEVSGRHAGRRFFLFGGMETRGWNGEEEHAQIGVLAARHGVDRLLLLGGPERQVIQTVFQQHSLHGEVVPFDDLAAVKEYLLRVLQWGDTLLVKGPANTGVDRIAHDIVEAMAPNRFYLDLQAVTENVARFRRLVGPHTKILAMVKALAYGSDAIQLSRGLANMGVDMIGVSSADEGRQLRREGIALPILVMACTPEEVDKLPRHQLTPVVYSFEMVDSIAETARANNCTMDVHLEVDTGMGRLGVLPEQALDLAKQIERTGVLRLRGVMTHFSCADVPEEDEFTRQQLQRFQDVIAELDGMGFHPLICHAAATSGAVRFPQSHLGMVRIGLGLYGLAPSPSVRESLDLVPAVSLVSRIVKISQHHKGERIGYSGTYRVSRDGFRSAVVPMGYHDGIPWTLSNTGYVLINGQQAPICGRVSMDSMVVNVTDIPEASVGTDVLIYGERGGFVNRPETVAEQADTIVYELLARLGPRVQRIFLGL